MISLRLATEGDLPSILVMGHALVAEQAELSDQIVLTDASSLKKEMELETYVAAISADRLLLVAELDGELIGFIQARIVQNHLSFIRHKRCCYILNLFVVEWCRSCGYGSLLLDATTQWAASQEVASIDLSIIAENEAALRFYRRWGFRITKHHLSLVLASS